MNPIRKLPPVLLHGGDYNPDQWLHMPEILDEDIRLMKQAKVNCVNLGIFAWDKLEPEEGRYDFDWMAAIIDRLWDNGIYTILATPTGAMPHWLTAKYEEARQMTSRRVRNLHGGRHNFCPSAPIVREKMRGINSALSQRFGQHPGVIAWHLSNEYANNDNGGACHCPHCQAAFRSWLKARYKTLDALNHAWWTGFWANTYTDWEQIESPSEIGEHGMHGLKLDWKRFCSDQLLDFVREEIRALRVHSDRPTVANFMGFFKPMDYFKWARELDYVAYDSYPSWHTEETELGVAAHSAACYDLTRGLKKQPWLLMESTPSLVNWKRRNTLKRPGMHELSSLQAVAHGSDSVEYFQWRKGRGNFEKYHGAVVDHRNGSNTRVFRDVQAIGERMQGLTETVIGSCNQPRAAIVYDWENWWAVEDAAAVTLPFSYLQHWLGHYTALWKQGVAVDIVDMDDPLEGYDLVIAPVNYMYRGNYIETVRSFVARGGTYVTTYWSGEVNDTDLCFLDRHPLSEVLGIRTEEIDVAPPYLRNAIDWDGSSYPTRDLLAIVHAETAEVLGTYHDDFYAGCPALTCNRYGEGKAWFIAAETEQPFLDALYRRLAETTGVAHRFPAVLPEGVVVTERVDAAGKPIWFLQNFNRTEASVALAQPCVDAESGETLQAELRLETYRCRILRPL